MVSDLLNTDCDPFLGALDEKSDIPNGDNFYFLPRLYNIEHYITLEDYKTIRANKSKAIDVSLTETGYVKCLIKDIEFTPINGTLVIRVWAREIINLELIDNPDTEHETP
jgi:hypothetical protein